LRHAAGAAKKGQVPLGGELTRQKALLDELFARVPEAIVLIDADDRLLRVNPEFTKIFGYAQDEACGRRINELVVPEELLSEGEEYSRRCIRGESSRTAGPEVQLSIPSGIALELSLPHRVSE